MLLNINVKNKIAESIEDFIVCGNSDYVIEFSFDSEWESYDVKTARFIWNGQREERVFNGNQVEVPIIRNATVLAVGVYAGNLHTTTPSLIRCKKSILCEDGLPADPDPDVYAQLLEEIAQLKAAQTGTLVLRDWEESDVEGGEE